MGLDGISVNQIRITSENNSSETNKIKENSKVIDGLSKGKKIDPDEKKENQNKKLNKENKKTQDEEEKEEQEENINFENLITNKHDLSDTKKYSLNFFS